MSRVYRFVQWPVLVVFACSLAACVDDPSAPPDLAREDGAVDLGHDLSSADLDSFDLPADF